MPLERLIVDEFQDKLNIISDFRASLQPSRLQSSVFPVEKTHGGWRAKPAVKTQEMIALNGLVGGGRPTEADQTDQMLFQRRRAVEVMVNHSHETLTPMENVMFMAGGSLGLELGDKNSLAWRLTLGRLKEGPLVLAGIPFSQTELQLIGNWSRFLQSKGFIFHCIDERLDEEENIDSEIHCQCGMCGAYQNEILPGHESGALENILMNQAQRVNPNLKGKQRLLSSSLELQIGGAEEIHESTLIMVSLGETSRAVRPDQRQYARLSFALPFNVSLPVPLLLEFIDTMSLDDESINTLLESLIKWNVKVARTLIGSDHHNIYHGAADQTQLIVDPVQTSELSADDRETKLQQEILYRLHEQFIEDQAGQNFRCSELVLLNQTANRIQV